MVRREHGGRQLMRRAPDRFPATDLLVAARPQLRLEHMLRTPHDFDLPGGVMAVLIGALGVESVLDPELDRSQIRDLFEELEKHLPDDFLALVEGVRATGSAVSLRVRR